MDVKKLYPFWDKLNDNQKEMIENACYTEKYTKGMLMHRSEENCKGLVTITEGRLRTYIVSEEGREITLFQMLKGDVCILSASCLMDSIDFDVLIEAVEDTEVTVLPSVCLHQVIDENKEVELYLYKEAAEKFSDVMWTMQQILFRKVDYRAAMYLVEEYERQGSSELKITHDEIARYIGSAREVITKVLKDFAEKKIIKLGRGKIIITDLNSLKTYN